jgi:tetratricopeptide (TPR) repeat protein
MRRVFTWFALALALAVTTGAWAQAKDGKDQKSKENLKLEELLAKGEYQKAIDLANKFIEAKEVTDGLYVDLGVAYQHLKNYPKAVESYEEAAKLNPFGTTALLNLASCYQEMNDEAKLEETFQRVLGVDPSLKDVRYSLALLYDKQEKPDQALGQYEELYKDDPGYKDVAYAIGLIFYNKDQFEKAEPYFAKALELKPGDEQILLAQGQNYIKGKKLEQAIPPLKGFLEVTKNANYIPAITGTVAGLYAKVAELKLDSVKNSKDKAAVAQAEAAAKEDYGNAVTYFDKLLALRPGSEMALEGKANALIRSDRGSEAIPVLKQFLQISQNDAEKKKVQELVKQLEAASKKR